MEHAPRSPEEIIDPRWTQYLHPRQSRQRGSASRDGGSGGHDEPDDGPLVEPAHHGGHPARPASDSELNAEIAKVLEPWRAGKAGPRSTLEGLRDLAERWL